MSFVPEVGYSFAILFSFGGLALAGIVLGITLAILKRLKPYASGSIREYLLPSVVNVACVIGAVGLLGGPIVHQAFGKVDRSERITAQISETYGLDFDYEQISALKYPEHQPKRDFQSFGSVSILEQGENRKSYIGTDVYLVWEDGKMILAETSDGKAFKALKPQR